MQIAILGCGYVGTRLGDQLLADGHSVVGVRRSDAGLARLEAAGLEGVRADVTDAKSLTRVPDVDVLVFSASSNGRGAAAARDVYLEGLETTISAFGQRDTPPDRLIYTSSTGVYGDHDGAWVDESIPVSRNTARQRVLVTAETTALETARSQGISGTVARFAGLYGPDRYRLSRYLDGPVTEGYLNLVHQEDAAGAVRYLINGEHAMDDTVLVVDNEPVQKWTFADWLADQCNEPPPEKLTLSDRLESVDDAARKRRIAANKRCSNAKLRRLGYSFTYPTFREGYRAAVEEYLEAT